MNTAHSQPKLYVYDHCPFCVRARMVFGLKNLPFEMAVLDSDDEATPISMIGSKMLPILQDQDGFMGESLDIVRKIDGLNPPIQFDGEVNPQLERWLKKYADVVAALVMPRAADAVYAEFHSASAREYFTHKKEARFGKFEALLANTEMLKNELHAGFAELIDLLPSEGSVGIDDIVLFPVLRTLTIMPDIDFPLAIADYAKRMSAQSGVPLVSELRAEQAK